MKGGALVASLGWDEKALVKVELWSAEKGEAQAKGGVLVRVELWSRSSGDNEFPVQEEVWSRSAGDDEALVKMDL